MEKKMELEKTRNKPEVRDFLRDRAFLEKVVSLNKGTPI